MTGRFQMALKLSKGGSYSGLNLSKGNQPPTQVQFALGWKPQVSQFVGKDFDLDAQALVVTGDPFQPQAWSEQHFVYFEQRRSPDGAIWLSEDDKTGAGDGDDEVITIDLSRLPYQATGVIVLIDIHEAPQRRQSFMYVNDAYARVLTNAGGGGMHEDLRLDLDDSFPHDTTVVIGGIFRSQPGGYDWKFQPLGQGYNTGLAPVLRRLGLNV